MSTGQAGGKLPDDDIGTLAQTRRARNLRRLGLALLVAVVVLALTGFLGPRERTTSARLDTGLGVSVTHPTIVRPGMEIDVLLEVEVPGVAEEVTVVVDQDLFERAGIELAVPEPLEQSALDGRVRMVFDLGDTDRPTLLLTGRIPTQAPVGRVRTRIHVSAGDEDTAAPVELTMWVLP